MFLRLVVESRLVEGSSADLKLCVPLTILDVLVNGGSRQGSTEAGRRRSVRHSTQVLGISRLQPHLVVQFLAYLLCPDRGALERPPAHHMDEYFDDGTPPLMVL